jgi:hypothetical protein
MEPIASKIRWSRPWFLRESARGIALPPFGIWIDPVYKDTTLGSNIQLHEVVHWNQYGRHPLAYYPRHIWHLLRRTPPNRNPLEVEAYKISGVW